MNRKKRLQRKKRGFLGGGMINHPVKRGIFNVFRDELIRGSDGTPQSATPQSAVPADVVMETEEEKKRRLRE